MHKHAGQATARRVTTGLLSSQRRGAPLHYRTRPALVGSSAVSVSASTASRTDCSVSLVAVRISVSPEQTLK